MLRYVKHLNHTWNLINAVDVLLWTIYIHSVFSPSLYIWEYCLFTLSGAFIEFLRQNSM